MITTNYEISKQLKEAGFEGETNTLIHDPANPITGEKYPSFCLEAILNVLPDEINNYLGGAFLSLNKIKYCTSIGYGNDIEYIENLYVRLEDMGEGSSLADAAGRLWLLLKEEGLV